MARFLPFAGIRYDLTRVQLDEVVSPPYDVIDEDERATLVERSPFNAVRVDLPADEDGETRYEVARRLLREWQDAGVLTTDVGNDAFRRVVTNAGAQVDFQLSALSALDMVLSFGGGVAFEDGFTPRREFMASFKILR